MKTWSWRVFALAFVVFAYFMPRWADWNIDSRVDLTHAIVDQATLRIDRFNANTWDKAIFKGHYYSDKAPGTALLGVPIYGLFAAASKAPVTGGLISAFEKNSAWNTAISLGTKDTQKAPAAKGRDLGGCQNSGVAGNAMIIPWGNRLYPPFQSWALSKYVLSAGVIGLISALFVAFFFWFLGFFTPRRALRWLLTGLYALGTIALNYSTVFYSHQLSAGFLFTAFGLLYLNKRASVGNFAPVAAGFLLGLAVFTEYTVLPIAAVLGVYGLWILRRRTRSIALLCLAGAVPLVGLLAYNYLCFGGPLDTGYSHDFCWTAAQGAGLAGFTYPKAGPLFDLTFGSFRGLFYLSPFLLLAVPGAWLMWKRGLRAEAVMCLAIGAAFILAISAYWGWNGGQVEGPRYLIPIIPFLAFPIVAFLDRFWRSRLAMTLIATLGAWSIFATGAMLLGGLLFPPSWFRNPLFDYSLPQLGANQIAPNAGYFFGLRGWQSLIPLLGLLAVLAIWRGPIRARGRSSSPATTHLLQEVKPLAER